MLFEVLFTLQIMILASWLGPRIWVIQKPVAVKNVLERVEDSLIGR